MAKLSLFFMVICLVGVLQQCSGFNYYWQTYPQTQDILNYPQLAPVAGIWQTDCDKKDGSSSSEDSSSKSSSESKEGKEEGGSSDEESKSSSEGEGSSSEEEKKGSEEDKEGSKEEKGSEEGSSSEEESGEKKEKKKSDDYIFPPSSYSFPPRPYQQVVYSAPSSYSYLPFRSSYLLQQPVAASYPVKSSYQYVTVPTSATVVSGYSSPYVSNMVNSPLASKVVYSAPTVSYPATSKVVVPSSRVYALPAAWSNALTYLKK